MRFDGRLLGVAACAFACNRPELDVVTNGACAGDAGAALPVVAAASFLDSLGMRIELDELDLRDDAGRTRRERLRELGVRHLHGGVLDPSARPSVLAAVAEGFVPLWRLGKNVDANDFFARWGDVALAISLPDPEDRTSASTFKAAAALEKARAIVELVRAQPEPRPRVVGFRVSAREDAEELGDLSHLVDYGGFRSTIGPFPPSASFGAWLSLGRAIAPGRPLMATMMGYKGAPAAQAGSAGETEAVQAKYVVRMLLASLELGIARTYYTTLVECSGCFDGLVRTDGTPKPAYLAWQAMVQMLEPAGPTTSPPTTFGFSLEGDAAVLPSVRHVRLGRSDGKVVMFLWLEVTSRDDDVETWVTVRPAQELRRAWRAELRPGTLAPLDAQAPLRVRVADLPVAVILEPAARCAARESF